MNLNTIIELKESNAIYHNKILDIHGNYVTEQGNYEVMLDKNIPMNDGDQISIKSIYIDSIAASSQKIVVETDTPIEISCCNYIQNIDTTNRSYNDSIFPSVPTNQPDGLAYFACNKTTDLDVATVSMVGQITIYQDIPNKSWGGKELSLKLIYTNVQDRLATVYLPIPYNKLGNIKSYVYNSTTYPDIFPLYFTGSKANLLHNIQDHTVFTPIDNVNSTSIHAGTYTGVNPMYQNVADAVDFKELTGITLHSVIDDHDKAFGGTNITIQALSWKTGLRFSHVITLPLFPDSNDSPKNVTGVGNGFSDVFMVIPDTDGGNTNNAAFVVTSPSASVLRDTYNTLPTDHTNLQLGVVDFASSFTYKINSCSTIFPAGSYTLEEVCEKLTDLLTDIEMCGQTDFENYPVNSPFLHTNNQLKELNGITGVESQYYCSENGDSYFSFVNDTQDKWIGSDQVSFIGDPVLNKAKISSIHSNLYNATPNISTKFIKLGTAEAYKLIGRNGGIVFTELKPNSFFQKLGFSFDPINTPTAQPQTVQSVIGGSLSHLQKITATIGKTTTSSITGLSNAIIKSSFTDFNGMASMLGYQSTNSNFEIISTNDISTNLSNNGYFLIEITGIPQNEVIGNQIFNPNIQAIISRYYSTESFTSAYNEGSISTIYKGASQMLSKFRVRILDPNGNVVQGLGNNTCIFLQIDRADNQK